MEESSILKMSSAFKILSSIGSTSKPYHGFSKLNHGYYEIEKFRFVKNKLYKPNVENPRLKRVLLVELKEEVLFLPEYFAANFNDDDAKVEELNTDGIKKYLYFGGKRPNK